MVVVVVLVVVAVAAGGRDGVEAEMVRVCRLGGRACRIGGLIALRSSV